MYSDIENFEEYGLKTERLTRVEETTSERTTLKRFVDGTLRVAGTTVYHGKKEFPEAIHFPTPDHLVAFCDDLAALIDEAGFRRK